MMYGLNLLMVHEQGAEKAQFHNVHEQGVEKAQINNIA